MFLRSPAWHSGVHPGKARRAGGRASSGGARAYLAGEEHRGGHLLHRQVPDAGRQGAPARRAAAQLLAAWVAHQVPGLALQDRGQHIVEAHGALEERGQLVVLRGRRGAGPAAAAAPGPAASRARDHPRRRGGHRGRAGARARDGGGGRGRSRARGAAVLGRWRRLAAGLASAGAGGGRAAHRAPPRPPWTSGRLPAGRGAAGGHATAPGAGPGGRAGTATATVTATAGARLGLAPRPGLSAPRSRPRAWRGVAWRAPHRAIERATRAQPRRPARSGAPAADASPGGARGRDVTSRHVCGRPGARGRAQPPPPPGRVPSGGGDESRARLPPPASSPSAQWGFPGPTTPGGASWRGRGPRYSHAHRSIQSEGPLWEEAGPDD